MSYNEFMIACSRHNMFEENLGLVTDYILKHYHPARCMPVEDTDEYSILKHYPPARGMPVEDTDEYSWGCYGLWKACLTFERDRGNKFSTYAFYCIRNAIINGFRQNSRQIPTIDPVEIDGKNCSSENSSNPYQMVELILQGDKDEKPRDKIDREMLVLYYLEGMTLEEVGKRFQVTKNRVRQRIGRAIQLIRTLFESECNAQEFVGI